MSTFSLVNEASLFVRLRRVIVVLAASLCLLLITTACSPADTTASTGDVPEATPADVSRAQGNLSDEAVDVDALSQQSASQAKRSGSPSI